MTFIAEKSFARIKQTIRNLTPRRSPRPLTEVIIEVNAGAARLDILFPPRDRRAALLVPQVLHLETDRGLATRAAPLDWTKVKRWLRRPDGSWRTIATEDAVLFDPTRLRIERYLYRGTRIPSPYDPVTTS
jgi:RNA-directed DNA polymerase